MRNYVLFEKAMKVGRRSSNHKMISLMLANSFSSGSYITAQAHKKVTELFIRLFGFIGSVMQSGRSVTRFLYYFVGRLGLNFFQISLVIVNVSVSLFTILFRRILFDFAPESSFAYAQKLNGLLSIQKFQFLSPLFENAKSSRLCIKNFIYVYSINFFKISNNINDTIDSVDINDRIAIVDSVDGVGN